MALLTTWTGDWNNPDPNDRMYWEQIRLAYLQHYFTIFANDDDTTPINEPSIPLNIPLYDTSEEISTQIEPNKLFRYYFDKISYLAQHFIDWTEFQVMDISDALYNTPYLVQNGKYWEYINIPEGISVYAYPMGMLTDSNSNLYEVASKKLKLLKLMFAPMTHTDDIKTTLLMQKIYLYFQNATVNNYSSNKYPGGGTYRNYEYYFWDIPNNKATKVTDNWGSGSVCEGRIQPPIYPECAKFDIGWNNYRESDVNSHEEESDHPETWDNIVFPPHSWNQYDGSFNFSRYKYYQLEHWFTPGARWKYKFYHSVNATWRKHVYSNAFNEAYFPVDADVKAYIEVKSVNDPDPDPDLNDNRTKYISVPNNTWVECDSYGNTITKDTPITNEIIPFTWSFSVPDVSMPTPSYLEDVGTTESYYSYAGYTKISAGNVRLILNFNFSFN